MPATFAGIQNENEFYSHHYLAELFANDIQATTARWRESAAESSNGARTPDQALRALARPVPSGSDRISAANAGTRPASSCSATGSGCS